MNVNEEDRKLQDLLHEMEFAPGRTERNQAAARLQRSRRIRREYKDIVKWNERIVKFFEEPKSRDTLNRMRQLLGLQQKEEEYLLSERICKPRTVTKQS
jgi:predicted HTH domain antitoxin